MKLIQMFLGTEFHVLSYIVFAVNVYCVHGNRHDYADLQRYKQVVLVAHEQITCIFTISSTFIRYLSSRLLHAVVVSAVHSQVIIIEIHVCICTDTI